MRRGEGGKASSFLWVNSSVSNLIDGLLKILQTTECLFITEERKYYANPMERQNGKTEYGGWLYAYNIVMHMWTLVDKKSIKVTW